MTLHFIGASAKENPDIADRRCIRSGNCPY